MIKLKLAMVVSILSLSLFAKEEFYEVVEEIPDTQYKEIGVISEPTIIESSELDNMEIIEFEPEPQQEQEIKRVEPILDATIVQDVAEENLSKKEDSNSIFVTYNEALKIAKENNKIILLEVVIDNCPFCKKMEKKVLTTDRVQEAIKKDFVLAQVNGTKETLPLGLSSQMTPMFVFVTNKESVEDMRFGFIEEDDFLKLLKEEGEKLAKD